MNTQKRNGNGAARSLLWIGSAIFVSVGAAWFLDQTARAWNASEHRAIENKVELKYEALHEDILELKCDVKEILKKTR
jgi:hypothetical protein